MGSKLYIFLRWLLLLSHAYASASVALSESSRSTARASGRAGTWDFRVVLIIMIQSSCSDLDVRCHFIFSVFGLILFLNIACVNFLSLQKKKKKWIFVIDILQSKELFLTETYSSKIIILVAKYWSQISIFLVMHYAVLGFLNEIRKKKNTSS